MNLVKHGARMIAFQALAAVTLLGSAGYSAETTDNTCPNLSGAYTCKSEGKDVALSLSQETVNNQTIYTLTEDNQSTQLPSDNVEYKIDDKANHLTGTARFVCENQSFNAYLKGQRSDNAGKLVESWDLVQGLSLDNAKNLVVRLTGHAMQKGITQPVNEANTCVRNTNSVK
jgi:hypothetical protein